MGHMEEEMVEGIGTMSAPQERKQVIAERLNEAGGYDTCYSKSAVQQAMGSAAEFSGASEPVKAKARAGEAAAVYGWATRHVTTEVEVPRECYPIRSIVAWASGRGVIGDPAGLVAPRPRLDAVSPK